MDYSTINLEALRKLPVAKLAPTYQLQRGSGSGCYGDPPGYPTYFTREVYTSYGNPPNKGATQVIIDPTTGKEHVTAWGWNDKHRPKFTSWDDEYAQRQALLHSLYLPLPFEHERVQLWVRATLRHFHHCYEDVERPEYNKPGTLIFPVPAYKLKHFRDDERWNDTYRAACRAEVDAFNTQEIERATRIATIDNHKGVQIIRRFYPEYTPTPEEIEHVSSDHEGDWWETEAVRPTTEECPKVNRNGIGSKTHARGTDTWCQFCGWRAEKASA